MRSNAKFPSFANPSVARRRATLMGGVATLLMASAAANAEPVRTTEGQPTVQGDINLTSGNDQFYVSVFRAGADGSINLGAIGDYSALATGTVKTNGGTDRLYLTASGTQSVKLINVPLGSKVGEFTGGIGYYLENGANLTLGESSLGATYRRELILGGDGDGTVKLDSNIQRNPGERAIFVEQTDGAGLDVTVNSWITGYDYRPGTRSGLVDAYNANSFTLTSEGQISIIRGTALYASQNLTTIEEGSRILATDAYPANYPIQDALLVDASNGGTIRNFGDIREQGDAAPQGDESADTIATGVLLGNGATFINERTSPRSSGRIMMHGTAVSVQDGTVVNHGLIQSDMDVAVRGATYGVMTVRNEADGTIEAFARTNTGAIDHYTTAIAGGVSSDFVVNAGTINGDINLGHGADMYLDAVDAAGNVIGKVNGVIDGDRGDFDAYGRSFSSNGNYSVTNATLHNHDGVYGFERHGVEALGAETVATFTSNETLYDGLSLHGNGTIVNKADITVDATNAVSTFGMASNDANGLSFINDVGADLDVTQQDAAYFYGNLKRVENRGTVLAQGLGANGFYIVPLLKDGSTFTFANSGSIKSDSVAAAITMYSYNDPELGSDVDFTNSGDISGLYGAAISNPYGGITFNNSGSIVGDISAVDMEGYKVRLTNSGTMRIDPESDRGYGTLNIAAPDIEVTNSGTISTVAGEDYLVGSALALSVGTGKASFTNEATGRIEAAADHSVAVAVVGSKQTLAPSGMATFNLTNKGQILGAGIDTLDSEGGMSAGHLDFGYLTAVAGAIQTLHTVDTIINDGNGYIFGNVDLADGDDRVELRGTSILNGDLRLGEGDDTLLLAGGSLNGMAFGGDGMDTLLIDLSADRTIVGDQFSSFETIKRDGTGTGILHASGTFDIETLNLDGMTVMVDAGKTLATQGSTAITGSDNNERLIVSGTIDGSVSLGGGDDFLDLASGGSVNGTINGGDGNDTIGFRLTANGGTDVIPDVINFESLAVSGNYTLTLDKAFDSVTLREGADLVVTADAGTIANIYGDDTDQDVTVFGKLTGGVSLGGGNDTLALMDVSGVISGAIDGGAGQDKLMLNLTGATEFGDGAKGFENIFVTGASPLTMNGTFGAGQLLTFGDDDNTLIIGAGAVFAGSVDGGAGSDTLTINTGAADTRTVLSGQIANFETLNANGPGWLSLTDGAFAFNDVTIDGGNLAIGANSSLTSSGVNFTSGDNRLSLASGATISGAVDAGDGDDTLMLEQAANTVRKLTSIDGFETFEHLESKGEGELQVDADAVFASVALDGGLTSVLAEKTLTGPVTGGALAERIALNGAIVGNLDLGNGANVLAIASGSSLTGNVTTGDQTDTLTVNGTLGGNVDLGGGADSLAIGNGGKLTGDVAMGAGADTVSVAGILAGNLDLGDGDDRLVLASLNSVTGARIGGAGTDTLALNTAGTYQAPTVYNGNGFDGFERLEVLGGVVSLTANTSWDDVDVIGGRLIGQAGTTLTSKGTIDVAKGATFGSAGTVNGNISVLGQLSPGASPGTMTVNGNVAFATGSSLLIELTPTAGTDLLDVHGNMAIADGATIDITGALGNAPGTALDIVKANAITGRFTTVNKSASVFGFVVQNDKKISIRSEFASSGDYPTNVQASIGYANQVLAGGYGVQAFTNALNVLTAADGTANKAAFAQLTPEAYGSAMEMGKEASLQLVDASRQFHLTAPIEDGFYVFGQGTTGDSKLKSNRHTGASSAKVEASGLVGGVGYGFGGGRFQVGAFTGVSDLDLKLTQLDARADGQTWHGGLYADAKIGGVGVHGLVSYGEGDVTMDRSLMVAPLQTAHGEFKLKNWVADASVDYRLSLGGLDLTPRAGVTYIKTKRDGLRETDAGDFSLAVDGASRDVWLGDVSLAASHTFTAGGASITPYGELGWRTRLGGEGTSVSGRFVGASGASITVDGVDRDKSAARFGVGVGTEVSRNVRFQVGYTGEFGASKQSTAAARATIRF